MDDSTKSRFLLPQKETAALLPGASYSLPGLFSCSQLLYQCLAQIREKFSYSVPVRYLYGAPRVRWNCGRLLIVDHPIGEDAIERELQDAVSQGITPLLTFSSTEITPEDLSDPTCNILLAHLDALHGGVIVSHPLLADYIRKQYPQIEIHASVIFTAFAPIRNTDYYLNLSRTYDRYVIHPDDNFRPQLLAQIPKENAEIMLNERCGYQCAQRAQHYQSISQDQKTLIDGGSSLSNFLDRCPFVPDCKQKNTPTRNISLSAQEAADLHQLGFSLFKLQGRLDNLYVQFFEFLRYALENQVAFPALYPIFSYEIRCFIKEKQISRHSS